jgi:ankyrin repeat protein
MLIEAYPDALTIRDELGAAPIHILVEDSLPLHLVCGCESPDLDVARVLFDAYPEAIICTTASGGDTPLDIARYNSAAEDLVPFLETQMAYARLARNVSALSTLDANDWLPLHHALHDATLGAIKLLVKGNPSATRVIDRDGKLPLHIACEFSTLDVVKFLLDSDSNDTSLTRLDVNSNSPLHYACRGGNCSVVKYLLEKRAAAVSKINGENKLPVQLLCESNAEGLDRDGTEYIETIMLLLLAHPEAVPSL